MQVNKRGYYSCLPSHCCKLTLPVKECIFYCRPPITLIIPQTTRAAVRKKACMAIHRFWLKAPDSISHLSDKLRVVLCDRDPSVMAASLCLFLDMARVDSLPFRDLIPSFVSILKQVQYPVSGATCSNIAKRWQKTDYLALTNITKFLRHGYKLTSSNYSLNLE